MRVGTRLYLGVVPAVLGVMVVAALAYWGERGRQAPALIVLIALVASLSSLVIVWRNTRYLAHRIGQLAQSRSAQTVQTPPSASPAIPGDELDEIEAAVDGLRSTVVAERTAGERRAHSAEARATEYAELLDDAVSTMSTRLDEAHLPVHVLLSSPFGVLNENQEELLTAAQQSIEAADTTLRRLRKLIDIDRGDLPLVPEPISVGELLRAPLAIAQSRAIASVVRLTADLPDTLPRARVDAVHTQEALTALLCDSVAQASAGGEIAVRASQRAARELWLTIAPSGSARREPLDVRLARRVIDRAGGQVLDVNGGRQIQLPAEAV